MLSSFANLQMPKYRSQYQFHQRERELIHYIEVSLSKTENVQRLNKAIDKKKKLKWPIHSKKKKP